MFMNRSQLTALALLAWQLMAQPSAAQTEFCLAPIKPAVDASEYDTFVRTHRRFEALRATPKNQRFSLRLAAFSTHGCMDMTVWYDPKKDVLNPTPVLVVRILGNDEDGAERQGAFAVELSEEFVRVLHAATEKVLENTSYHSGSRAFVGMDGSAFEFTTDFMAGMCAEPPASSSVGRVIALWLELCALQAGTKLKLPRTFENPRSLQQISQDLEALVQELNSRKVKLEPRSLLDPSPDYPGPDLSLDYFLRAWLEQKKPRAKEN